MTNAEENDHPSRGTFECYENYGEWAFSRSSGRSDYELECELISPRTDAFDLVAANPSGGVTWDGKHASFEMCFCYECDDHDDCNGGYYDNEFCAFSGTTRCDKKYFHNATAIGPRCDSVIKCDKIAPKNEVSSRFGDSYYKGNQSADADPHSWLKHDACEYLVCRRPDCTNDCFNYSGAHAAMHYSTLVGSTQELSRASENKDTPTNLISTPHEDSAQMSDFQSFCAESMSPTDVK